MKEYIQSQIDILKEEIEYYSSKIEEAKNNKESIPHRSPASDNYYDREIFYAEYHLFRTQAELERLENRGRSRILK